MPEEGALARPELVVTVRPSTRSNLTWKRRERGADLDIAMLAIITPDIYRQLLNVKSYLTTIPTNPPKRIMLLTSQIEKQERFSTFFWTSRPRMRALDASEIAHTSTKCRVASVCSKERASLSKRRREVKTFESIHPKLRLARSEERTSPNCLILYCLFISLKGKWDTLLPISDNNVTQSVGSSCSLLEMGSGSKYQIPH